MTKTNPYSIYQGKLRRLWEESPMKYEALRRAKVDVNQYKCELCKNVVIYKLIEVDHIEPVVGIKGQSGTTDADKLVQYVTRLNCHESRLQVLCYDCHKSKSAKEATQRSNARKLA